MAADRFAFWQTWLVWACASTVVLGLALALFDTRLIPGFPQAVNESLWGSPTMPAEVAIYHRFVHGVLGATIASWAVVLVFVARVPFRAREPWAWWCVFTALAVWFPVDTALSVRFGVWPNVAFNVVALVFIGTPLVFTRGAFRR